MKKEDYIKLIDKYKKQIKDNSKNKNELSEKIRRIRKENHITLYDYLKWKRDN